MLYVLQYAVWSKRRKTPRARNCCSWGAGKITTIWRKDPAPEQTLIILWVLLWFPWWPWRKPRFSSKSYVSHEIRLAGEVGVVSGSLRISDRVVSTSTSSQYWPQTGKTKMILNFCMMVDSCLYCCRCFFWSYCWYGCRCIYTAELACAYIVIAAPRM